MVEHETGFDVVLGFSLPDRDVRGRCVRLGPVLETVLSAHEYPAPIRLVLSEALVLAALIGSLVKDPGSQMTLQAQAPDGVIDLLVCDYRNGAVRGYVRHDPECLADLGTNPSLQALFGAKGFLALTFDMPSGGGRYQGIVPLDGANLTEACEHYFRQSEQVPTVLRVAIQSDGAHCTGGGFLIQHLPDGEDGRERLHVRMDDPDWEHVAVMGGSVRYAELIDSELSLEALLWRLFHEETELRVEPVAHLSRGCRCTVEHYVSVLSRFPEDDLAAMREDDGTIYVDCAFCSKTLAISI